MREGAAKLRIPSQSRRLLVAMWVSFGLHAVLIAFVRVAPPDLLQVADTAMEVRLHPAQSDMPVTSVRTNLAIDTHEGMPEREEREVNKLLPDEADRAPSELVQAMADERSGVVEPPPLASIKTAVDLTYYSAKELDAIPDTLVDFQSAMERLGQSGKWRLKLKIEANGRVSGVEVLNASPGRKLDDSVMKFLRDAHFVPALKNGLPVRALIIIELGYEVEG